MEIEKLENRIITLIYEFTGTKTRITRETKLSDLDLDNCPLSFKPKRNFLIDYILGYASLVDINNLKDSEIDKLNTVEDLVDYLCLSV